MKIYTRTGDDGTTGLIGGSRVPKCNPRLECSGTIDELNAALGVSVIALDPSLRLMVSRIQNELFVIGAHLATPAPGEAGAAPASLPALDDRIVAALEMEIDAAEAALPMLRNFILPGGTEAAARLHLARTICRRAERTLVEFAGQRPVAGVILTYMNRLSDWLFVHARLANQMAGIPDVLWLPREK